MRKAVVVFVACLLGAGLYVTAPDGADAATTQEFLFATGAGPGGGPHVKVFRASDRMETASFYAFPAAFTGGVNVAMGDIDGDGDLEVITAAGPGGGPHIKVFTDRGAPFPVSFFVYPGDFAGGVNVGVADLDGDGDDEILAAPGAGLQPVVRAFDYVPETGAINKVREFLAYNTNWLGGVTIAGAYTQDRDEEGIVTGVGPGGGPHVRVWDYAGFPVGGWYAYDPAFNGGVSVGSYYADDNDEVSEIVTGAGAGRGHLRDWNVSGQFLSSSFYAFDASVNSGIDVSGALSGSPVGPFLVGQARDGATVRGFTLQGVQTFALQPYGPSWPGGVSVAAAYGAFTDPPPTTTTTGPSTTSSSTSTTSTSTSTTSSTSSTTSTTAPGGGSVNS